MTLDFTLKTYKRLLESFVRANYSILTFEAYLKNPPIENSRFLILRHDVDELAENALKMARLESSMGIHATYFFRIVRKSNKPEIIQEIASLGHEIGYHYEDLSTAQGDMNEAIKSFVNNLEYFRLYYPVSTICMHGSSTSNYDNRSLWSQFNFRDYNILGEPYLSIDFDEIFYITDTGYAWDGGKYAIRDIVVNNHGRSYHTTHQMIQAIDTGEFPRKTMLLAHTLWSPNTIQWFILHYREILRNNIKYASQKHAWIASIYAKLVKLYWK